MASPTSPHDYFADGVLRYLFLRLCGADPENGMGGDPETARKILYLGRSVTVVGKRIEVRLHFSRKRTAGRTLKGTRPSNSNWHSRRRISR